MAKKSKIARNEQRKVIVERYAERRAELKKTLVDPNATDEAREAARVGLQKLPRNASPARVRSRDVIDGRPRGVLTKFGISRVRFRDMAHRGELPGSSPLVHARERRRARRIRRVRQGVPDAARRPERASGRPKTCDASGQCDATRREIGRNPRNDAEIRVAVGTFEAVTRPTGSTRSSHPHTMRRSFVAGG